MVICSQFLSFVLSDSLSCIHFFLQLLALPFSNMFLVEQLLYNLSRNKVFFPEYLKCEIVLNDHFQPRE